jgi:hypothetical protein
MVLERSPEHLQGLLGSVGLGKHVPRVQASWLSRTLVQMPLGEIVGYSANLKHNDHVINVICFQYNGDVLNQIIELEKCLDTIHRN